MRMESISRSSSYKAALKAVSILRKEGCLAYFVGGAVRDLLLGRMPKDIDVASSAHPSILSKLFPKNIEVGASFGIVKAMIDDSVIEIASFRTEDEYTDGRRPDRICYSESPEADALRRDFTMNALFLDPESGEILDFVGGREDIGRGLLRTVGDANKRFEEDHLRILRALRFASRFGFEMDSAVSEATRKNAGSLSRISAERIRDELSLMLCGPRPAMAFRLMADLKVLDTVLPEIMAMRGVEQCPEYHPEGDVFEHTMIMLEHLALPDPALAWSVLLHDVGKVPAKSVGDDGVPHFYRHERLGASMASEIMARLKFPSRIAETVTQAVGGHMVFAQIEKMKESKWKRIFARESFPIELELHRIDCASSHKKNENYCLMLDRLVGLASQTALPEPFVRGRDLISAGFEPGPLFSGILSNLLDMQMEGLLPSREDALAFLSEHADEQFWRDKISAAD